MPENLLSESIVRPPVGKLFVLLAGLLLPLAGYAVDVDRAGGMRLSALTLSPLTVEQNPAKRRLKEQDLVCLAMNIYHEGRGEPTRGQAAIAAVTMNRVHNRRYPDTVCSVVWQPKQFSWTRLAPHYHAIRDDQAWKKAQIIAELFLNGARMAQVGEATHYHAVNVQPVWIKNSRLIAQIGGHIFYTL